MLYNGGELAGLLAARSTHRAAFVAMAENGKIAASLKQLYAMATSPGAKRRPWSF